MVILAESSVSNGTGQKFLHCPGTKGQWDKLKILPRDRTRDGTITIFQSKSGTGCRTGRERGVCLEIFAPALILGQRDNGTSLPQCPGKTPVMKGCVPDLVYLWPGFIVYNVNYVIGKNKNTRTVQAESSKFASVSFDQGFWTEVSVAFKVGWGQKVLQVVMGRAFYSAKKWEAIAEYGVVGTDWNIIWRWFALIQIVPGFVPYFVNLNFKVEFFSTKS